MDSYQLLVVKIFMQLLNFLSRLQWAVLLLLNVAFIPATVYAAPIALFSADRYSGLAPLVVVVDAGNSSPWEGPDRITRIEWIGTGILIKNQISTAIQLSTPGEQTITLTVWNAAGESNSQNKKFKISHTRDTKPPFLSQSEGASFYGGVLDNDLFLSNESSFSSSTSVEVKATIEVAAEHIGMKANILVGVQLPKGQWYLKTESTAFPFIASDLKPPFIAAESSIVLGSTQEINVLTGHFKNMQGSYKVLFGYLLESDKLVYNEGAPLSFEVTPSESQLSE